MTWRPLTHPTPAPRLQPQFKRQLKPQLPLVVSLLTVKMSVDEIGGAFVQHYYQTLDSNPAGLAGLYQATSTLTFEGQSFVGADAIIAKYASLGGVQHNIPQISKDVQATPGGAALIIFVTGQLITAGQTNPLLFSHVFHLVATGPGQYFISNELFRLIYA